MCPFTSAKESKEEDIDYFSVLPVCFVSYRESVRLAGLEIIPVLTVTLNCGSQRRRLRKLLKTSQHFVVTPTEIRWRLNSWCCERDKSWVCLAWRWDTRILADLSARRWENLLAACRPVKLLLLKFLFLLSWALLHGCRCSVVMILV